MRVIAGTQAGYNQQDKVQCLRKKKNIIQFDKISETDRESIARTFLPMIEDYFQDEQVQKKYEVWLENYKKRK